MSQNNFNKNYNRLTEQWIKEYAEEKAGENIVFSPFSLVTLLSIAADATAGKTKDEIEKYLCKGINFKDFRGSLKRIQDTFAGTDEISTANAVIVKEDLRNTIQPLYEETLRDRFDGKLFLSKCVAEDVNDWVKEKTNGLIPEIASSSVEEMLVAILNAIAFDAQWKEDYEDEDLKTGDFKNCDDSISTITTLSSRESDYIENETFTGFIKPYKNDRFSFIALLPKEDILHIDAKVLNAINFTGLYSESIPADVIVTLPEFKYTFEDELMERFKNSGIKKLFTPQADFRPLSTTALKANSLKHKALIEVSRYGTKAAAVSLLDCGAGCADLNIKFVYLDRPFVYAIIENDSGLPVFAGVVNHLNEASPEELNDIDGRKRRREALRQECKKLYVSIGESLNPDFAFNKGTPEYDFHYRAKAAYFHGHLEELKSIEKEVAMYLVFKDSDTLFGN